MVQKWYESGTLLASSARGSVLSAGSGILRAVIEVQHREHSAGRIFTPGWCQVGVKKDLRYFLVCTRACVSRINKRLSEWTRRDLNP